MTCIIDTNVPLQSGKSVASLTIEEAKCAKECSRFIHDFINNPDSILVLDANGKVYEEYRTNIEALRNEPNLAKQFLNWVHIYHNKRILPENHVQLTEIAENEFVEFPSCSELNDFDSKDRKFVALANAHKEHPPIIEGTDGEWWVYRDVLLQKGISVKFLCEEYILSIQN